MDLPHFGPLKLPEPRAALASIQRVGGNNLGIPIMLLMLLGMMILPLPALRLRLENLHEKALEFLRTCAISEFNSA